MLRNKIRRFSRIGGGFMRKSAVLIALLVQSIWMQVPSAAAPKDPVALSPASLAFAAVTVGSTSAAQTVKITNNDSVALAISSISASGDFAIVQPTACGATLAAAKSCSFNVTFT